MLLRNVRAGYEPNLPVRLFWIDQLVDRKLPLRPYEWVPSTRAAELLAMDLLKKTDDFRVSDWLSENARSRAFRKPGYLALAVALFQYTKSYEAKGDLHRVGLSKCEEMCDLILQRSPPQKTSKRFLAYVHLLRALSASYPAVRQARLEKVVDTFRESPERHVSYLALVTLVEDARYSHEARLASTYLIRLKRTFRDFEIWYGFIQFG